MIIGNNSKVAQTLPNRGGTSSHGQNMKESRDPKQRDETITNIQ